LTCFVVESVPKNPKSGYSRRVAWIDAAEYRVQEIQFYNRHGDHEKTLTFEGYRQYLGKFWRADRMRMRNAQTGKETDLIWSDYRFNAGLTASDFDAQRLPQMAR
jgi:outer membrane lipoprotein-sorting protein